MATENTHLNALLQIYDFSVAYIQEPTLLTLTKKKKKTTLFKHCQAFETGLSDHYKLISTIMKSGIFKRPPKKKIYRSYKKFDNEYFSNALRQELETLEGDIYGEFEKIAVLNTHATIKTKMIRFNNNLFMTKEIRNYEKIKTKK